MAVFTQDQQDQASMTIVENTRESITNLVHLILLAAPDVIGVPTPGGAGIELDALPVSFDTYAGIASLPKMRVGSTFANYPGGIPMYNVFMNIARLVMLDGERVRNKNGLILSTGLMTLIGARHQPAISGADMVPRIQRFYDAVKRPLVSTEVWAL